MTQFIVLSNPRCGGILLGTVLGIDHPDVLYYGELFHPITEVRENEAARATMSGMYLENKGFSLPPWCPTNEQSDYMDSVFSQEGHKAVGFKVHFAQAKMSFWRFLEKNPKVKIIHLKRENVFHSYASYVKSLSTGQWHINGDFNVLQVKPTTIDPKKMLDYFQEVERQEEKLESLANPTFVVTYEALCNNFREKLKEIFRFLDLDTINPKKRTSKMTKNYSYIANLDEIVSFFKGSKYESWFETRA
jgi:hypothetical protein